jgi:hypothetical protein
VASVNEQNAAEIVRSAVGTGLIGAKGATPKDQDGIDDSIAGICAIGAYTKTECSRHNQ